MMTQDNSGNEASSGAKKKGVANRIGSVVGGVTGGSVIGKSVGYIPSTAGESAGRIGGLVSDLLDDGSKDLPSLGDGGTDQERFVAAMRLHGITEKSLFDKIRNTKRNADLYFVLLVASIIIGVVSLVMYPPAFAFSSVIRFIATPVLLAMTFKQAYTNWMFRNRRLSSPLAYFRSGDLKPKLPLS